MARILILTHEFLPFRGGIAAVADGLASGAAAVGHEPVVLAPDYHYPHASFAGPAGYEVHRFRGTTCRIARPAHLMRFAHICRRAIKNVKPDIVHAVDSPSQMALTALSRVRLIDRYFFTVHGSEALRYRRELVPRVWMSNAFDRVGGVASVSEAALELVQQLGLPKERGFVANPAIANIWHEATVGDRNATRLRWGASPADVVLFTLARLSGDKGHRDVIAALGKLPDPLRRRALYVIAGKGKADYLALLLYAARTAGVRILPLGQICDEEAVHAADAADLFVMPSRRTRKRLEGFGIAYIEAGARGLPSVARTTGGASEAVRHGETGVLLAEGGSTDELASTLQQLMESQELRKRLGSGAKRFARGFTWQRHAARVYDAFTKM